MDDLRRPESVTDVESRSTDDLRWLLKVVKLAQATYVGRHWPDKTAMRRDGIGFGLNDGEHEDRIRRFLYECQPEFLAQYLEAAIDRLAAAESQREALRAAFLRYLATDGHHGMWDAMVFSDANAEVVRLIGGEDVIRDEGDRLMRPYRAALKEQPREPGEEG